MSQACRITIRSEALQTVKYEVWWGGRLKKAWNDDFKTGAEATYTDPDPNGRFEIAFFTKHGNKIAESVGTGDGTTVVLTEHTKGGFGLQTGSASPKCSSSSALYCRDHAGPDPCVRRADLWEMPASACGLLTATAKGSGTGFILHPRIVATAAHCVLYTGNDPLSPDDPRNGFWFAPHFGSPNPAPIYKVRKVLTPADRVTTTALDFALCIMEENVSHWGQLKLGDGSLRWDSKPRLRVFGYPVNCNVAPRMMELKTTATDRYKCRDPIADLGAGNVGFSGGPWIDENGDVVGMTSAGSASGGFRQSADLFGRDFAKLYTEALREVGG